jgi:hypothetical protein
MELNFSGLLELPKEILVLIFEKCSPLTHLVLSQVCSFFRYDINWYYQSKLTFGKFLSLLPSSPLTKNYKDEEESQNEQFRLWYLNMQYCKKLTSHTTVIDNKFKLLIRQEYIYDFQSAPIIRSRGEGIRNFSVFFIIQSIYGELISVNYESHRYIMQRGYNKLRHSVEFKDKIPANHRILTPCKYFSLLRKYVVRLSNKYKIKHRKIIELSETSIVKYRLSLEDLISTILKEETKPYQRAIKLQQYIGYFE